LTLLFRQLANYPPLSRADEKRYWRQARAGHGKAQEALAKHNMRLVVVIAKRYRGHGLELADLVQDGYFGFRRAIEKFDPSRGYRFSTYATPWIRQACLHATATQGLTIAVPPHVQARELALRAIEMEHLASSGLRASISHFLERSNLPERHVREALSLPRIRASLDETLEDHEETRLHSIRDEDDPDVDDDLDRQRIRENLRDCLGRLPHPESEILALRFGIDRYPCTFQEIARKLGIERHRVVRIAHRALKQLGEDLNASRAA
jgi:RNA polymerase sigma factor (sigma-70 family)